MSKVQKLRALVHQRLSAAAEEIFGLFERTIAEYEEEASRSKEENGRQRKLLDAVLNPEVQLHRADVPQILVSKEEVPLERQEWSPSMNLEDPEAPHIKEEHEELWTSQETEQLQLLEEADNDKLSFTPVPLKGEDNGEKPQSSQTEENIHFMHLVSSPTEQMKTEADGEDCGVSEPDRNLDYATDLQPTRGGKTTDSSELETEDRYDDWMVIREPQSGLDTLRNKEVHMIGLNGTYVGEKTFTCLVCGKSYRHNGDLNRHMSVHTGKRPFICSICGKTFIRKCSMLMHMRVHTGEKPFSCTVCCKRFIRKSNMQLHMRNHTGEKPFSCSVCGRTFIRKSSVQRHMRNHTGEKPFGCSVCGKLFILKTSMQRHLRVHARDKEINQLVAQFPSF